MGTKQMRVSDDLYARVKSENREGETLAETLDRLVGGYSFADFADDAAELDLRVEEAADGDGAARENTWPGRLRPLVDDAPGLYRVRPPAFPSRGASCRT